MTNFAEMNKDELRSACKAAGISYGKLTVGGMRDALAHLNKVRNSDAPLTAEDVIVAALLTAPQVSKEDAQLIERCGHANCPSCGIHLSNGVLQDGDEKGDGTGHKMRLTHRFECMGCGTGFGPEVKRTERKPVANPGTGLKRQADRPKQNGVTRPSAGGKCAAVWDALDTILAAGE